MKKIFNLIVLTLLSSAIFISCKKEELKVYDGKEGIYFNVQWGPSHGNENLWATQPTTEIEFINLVEKSDTVYLKVMTTGRIKDYDRTFKMEVVVDSTTAIKELNYDPLPTEYTIKAGETFVRVPVITHRTENIQDEAKILALRLLPNEHFDIGIDVWRKLPIFWEPVIRGDFDATFHKVIMSDFVVRPSRWIGGNNNGVESGRWGEFTEKKYRLICDHFDLVYEDFTTIDGMPGARQENIQQYMIKLLQEHYDAEMKKPRAERQPILEEDGRLMWFLGVSWTSTIGVPWVNPS